MNRIYVAGLGAVSPAGWGVPALLAALHQGKPLPIEALPRPHRPEPLRYRPVPNPTPRPACLTHPRLRRASPLTHYAAAAALEALASLPAASGPDLRVGLITCLDAGCVNYSCRFYEEWLKDPATASPMLFPETVFSAPASHVAALINLTPLVYTVIGDPAAFLQGVDLAVDWLTSNAVDLCVVIGAEEANWLLGDAMWQLEHAAVLTGGAGAITLTCNPAWSSGVELNAITDAHTYGTRQTRRQAAARMRAQLPPSAPNELLCDGASESYRACAPELRAWQDWRGQRWSPKAILGEGLMAAAAWQAVAACAAVAGNITLAANVSLVGPNHQAIGARFIEHHRQTT